MSQHKTHEWVNKHKRHEWVIPLLKRSNHIWTSYVTLEWVKSRLGKRHDTCRWSHVKIPATTTTRHNTLKWVMWNKEMGHVDESCHIPASNSSSKGIRKFVLHANRRPMVRAVEEAHIVLRRRQHLIHVISHKGHFCIHTYASNRHSSRGIHREAFIPMPSSPGPFSSFVWMWR